MGPDLSAGLPTDSRKSAGHLTDDGRVRACQCGGQGAEDDDGSSMANARVGSKSCLHRRCGGPPPCPRLRYAGCQGVGHALSLGWPLICSDRGAARNGEAAEAERLGLLNAYDPMHPVTEDLHSTTRVTSDCRGTLFGRPRTPAFHERGLGRVADVWRSVDANLCVEFSRASLQLRDAKGWFVKRSNCEQPTVDHFDRLASSTVIRTDFDVAMTVVVQTTWCVFAFGVLSSHPHCPVQPSCEFPPRAGTESSWTPTAPRHRRTRNAAGLLRWRRWGSHVLALVPTPELFP